MTSSGFILTFASTVWVIDGIHNRAAHCGAHAKPTLAACLAYLDIGVLSIANLSNCGTTGSQDATHLM
jgi:hypothetical protein